MPAFSARGLCPRARPRSPPAARGRVSGLGVGLGYVGVLVALVVLGPLVPDDDNQSAFVPTAALFLVFALPCFLLVRELRRPTGEAMGGAVRASLTQLRTTLRNARRYGDVGRLLVARFLYVDAIATVIAYMTVYAKRTADLSDSALDLLLGVSLVAAAVGAFVAGLVVERVGPKRALVAVLAVLSVGLVVTATSGSPALLWFAGPLVGVALGTVWTSDRVFMLRLVPPEYRGEFFGLYGLVGKLSSGIGPLVLWAGTIWALSEVTDVAGEAAASRVAMVVLALAAVAGMLVLRPLSDAERSYAR